MLRLVVAYRIDWRSAYHRLLRRSRRVRHLRRASIVVEFAICACGHWSFPQIENSAQLKMSHALAWDRDTGRKLDRCYRLEEQ